MNKLVIELSGFAADGDWRNSRYPLEWSGRGWFRVRHACQGTPVDGDNALSTAIMLQIYIPKAIEESCWMCTLGHGWSCPSWNATPTTLKPLPSRLFPRPPLLLSRLSYLLWTPRSSTVLKALPSITNWQSIFHTAPDSLSPSEFCFSSAARRWGKEFVDDCGDNFIPLLNWISNVNACFRSFFPGINQRSKMYNSSMTEGATILNAFVFNAWWVHN